MTSANPPYPYFNGITYNPSFFTTSSSSSSSSGGLTETQANALYLKKTVPDIATGLETFSGGIATNSLNTTTTSSNLLIGATGNTGTITISTVNTGNTNASPAISIGTDSGTKTIKINNNTNSVHCSSIDLQNYSINNIVNATGDISIGDKQTTGVINLGTKVDRTGNINIGTGATGSCNINIGSTTSSIITNGMLNASGGIAMGSLKTISLGFVASDTTVLNTTYTAGTGTVTSLFYSGASVFIYTTTNSGNIPNNTNTIIYSTTVTNTGIYNISYCTRFSGSGTTAVVQGAQAWIFVSAPALYGGGGYGQLALTLVGYASPYLNLSTVGLATTASWTGLVNAGATVSIQVYLQYSTGNYTGFVLGGATNYLTLTRIA